MGVVKFFHHLLNPHCMQCREDKIDPINQMLRDMIDVEKAYNKQLIDRILEISSGKSNQPEQVAYKQSVEPIYPKHVPWKVKQAQLERDDFIKSQKLQEEKIKDDIDKLEKELGVEDASQKSGTV